MSKKGGFKGGKLKSSTSSFRLCSKVYFLTYRGTTDKGQRLTKRELVTHLMLGKDTTSTSALKPESYLVCEEMYDSGEPHFHVILFYSKRKNIRNPNVFDYLGIHPNIQTLRNLKAALEYVHKEDPNPLTNLDLPKVTRQARAKNTSSLYQLLEEEMRKDPFNFEVYEYCNKHDLGREICKTNYVKAVHLVTRMQQSYCYELLCRRPGIKYITRELIEKCLTVDELVEFDSYPCYARIIHHINQLVQYPNTNPESMLPDKTPHLYVVGSPNIGKSALITHRSSKEHPIPGLANSFSTFFLSLGQRFFPPYKSHTNSLVYWDEFTLDSATFPKNRYNELLVYLAGQPTQLPLKGRLPVRRFDNPKHILTSNLTLEQQISNVFKSEQKKAIARQNLRARIDEVIVPPGRSLHFLRKLFITNNE